MVVKASSLALGQQFTYSVFGKNGLTCSSSFIVVGREYHAGELICIIAVEPVFTCTYELRRDVLAPTWFRVDTDVTISED